MLHSVHRSLCGPQLLVVLLKGGSVENGAEGCMDRGCTEVGSDDSSGKEGRKVDRRMETLLIRGGESILRGVAVVYRCGVWSGASETAVPS